MDQFGNNFTQKFFRDNVQKLVSLSCPLIANCDSEVERCSIVTIELFHR